LSTPPVLSLCVFRKLANLFPPPSGWGWGQIKYFKEKRVMDHKRDQTIAKIKQDDADMAAKARRKRGEEKDKNKGGGGGAGWFS